MCSRCRPVFRLAAMRCCSSSSQVQHGCPAAPTAGHAAPTPATASNTGVHSLCGSASDVPCVGRAHCVHGGQRCRAAKAPAAWVLCEQGEGSGTVTVCMREGVTALPSAVGVKARRGQRRSHCVAVDTQVLGARGTARARGRHQPPFKICKGKSGGAASVRQRQTRRAAVRWQ